MLATLFFNANSKRKLRVKDFLPPWYEVPLPDPEEGFRRLLEMAENGGTPSPRSQR
jgi:hypothetical protein